MATLKLAREHAEKIKLSIYGCCTYIMLEFDNVISIRLLKLAFFVHRDCFYMRNGICYINFNSLRQRQRYIWFYYISTVYKE